METQKKSTPAMRSKLGFVSMMLFVIVLLVLAIFGGNKIFGYYLNHCSDKTLTDCMLNRAEEQKPEGSAVAMGIYTFREYSATVTAYIPLDGGAVTGSVSGTCGGTVKGTFDDQDGGIISGSIVGSCSPFFFAIPGKATFSGIVNKEGKKVPFSFIATGAGLTHEDAMVLSY